MLPRYSDIIFSLEWYCITSKQRNVWLKKRKVTLPKFLGDCKMECKLLYLKAIKLWNTLNINGWVRTIDERINGNCISKLMWVIFSCNDFVSRINGKWCLRWSREKERINRWTFGSILPRNHLSWPSQVWPFVWKIFESLMNNISDIDFYQRERERERML
ncbi:MAG: hypothetical protein ACTS5F_00545 [Candidatus Hodgkinia cicadicola]